LENGPLVDTGDSPRAETETILDRTESGADAESAVVFFSRAADDEEAESAVTMSLR